MTTETLQLKSTKNGKAEVLDEIHSTSARTCGIETSLYFIIFFTYKNKGRTYYETATYKGFAYPDLALLLNKIKDTLNGSIDSLDGVFITNVTSVGFLGYENNNPDAASKFLSFT